MHRALAALAQGIAVQHDLRTQRLGPRYFVERRRRRHDDGRRNVHAAPVEGHALGVISRRGGNHASLLLGGVQTVQLDQRAARLEGSGQLQVLELEYDAGAGQFRQRRRFDAGRAHQLSSQEGGSGTDVFDGYGHGIPDRSPPSRQLKNNPGQRRKSHHMQMRVRQTRTAVEAIKTLTEHNFG